MLTTVAEANSAIGRQPASRNPLSENSNPIETKAKIRNQVRRSFTVAISALPSLTHCRYSVPMTEAAMKPSTNFGNRLQNWPSVGRASSRLRRSTFSAK